MWAVVYQFGLFAAVILGSFVLTRDVKWRPLLAAGTVILVDIIVTVFTPSISGLDWNWTGKISSITISILILILFPSIRSRCGVTLQQKPGSIFLSMTIIAFLACLAVFLERGTPLVKFSMETIAYQSLMPTISEELIYRGTLLVLLTLALPKQVTFGKFSVGAGAIVACAIFGIGHGVAANGMQIVISWESLIWTTLIGILLTVMRQNSKSLIFPMIGHSIFNLVSETLPMFVAV